LGFKFISDAIAIRDPHIAVKKKNENIIFHRLILMSTKKPTAPMNKQFLLIQFLIFLGALGAFVGIPASPVKYISLGLVGFAVVVYGTLLLSRLLQDKRTRGVP